MLVVDDEKNIRLTLRQVLEEEGLHVETATDGAEALEQVRAHPDFDLVLMDLRMPGMDGMEALPKVRELRPDLPVVVFTAHGNAENATEAMKLGATDFAEKPFSPTQIRALVEEMRARSAGVLATKQSNDERPSHRDSEPPPHRTYCALVYLRNPSFVGVLLRLAAASARSYEGGEVLAVGLGEDASDHPGDRAAETVDLAAAAEQAQNVGVAVRTRAVQGTAPREALLAVVEEETPDHVLLAWEGPRGEARALNTLAQQLADGASCEVTLVRPGASTTNHRIAAVVSEAPHALVAVRRALEFAKSAGVASLTLVNAQPSPPEGADDNPMEEGLALIHRVAREAGLPQGKYYTQVAVAAGLGAALPRVAEDFDTLCISAAHADALIPALFREEGNGRIGGTVALVHKPAHDTSPTIMQTLIDRLTGGAG